MLSIGDMIEAGRDSYEVDYRLIRPDGRPAASRSAALPHHPSHREEIPMATFRGLTFDAYDAQSTALFWAAALGRDVAPGASSAHAIDLEGDSVPTTLDNAARNGVAERITAEVGEVAAVPGTTHVVVANIGGAVLFDLAPALVAHVAPGGRLLLAGVLEGRLDALVAAMAPLVEIERDAEGGGPVAPSHQTGE